MTESLAALIERREAEKDCYGFTHVVHTEEIRVVLDALVSLLDEYARTCNPAPYTHERALYERVRGLVDGGAA